MEKDRKINIDRHPTELYLFSLSFLVSAILWTFIVIMMVLSVIGPTKKFKNWMDGDRQNDWFEWSIIKQR